MSSTNTKQRKMLNQICSAVVLLLLLNAVLTVTIAAPDPTKYCACDEASINRRSFPDGFVFGSASAAYQVEGGYKEDGAGETMWSNFTHAFPEKIKDHSNGDVATDSYHLYKEDVRMLKNMGADAYRFSISWARILPGGSVSKGVNQAGINYYNALIDELLSNGIQPMVTIFHLDTPQALEDSYGGFLSSRIVADFRDFADVLFREFGDRVKYWVTINEPWALSYLGYTVGVFAPARCSSWLRSDCLGGDSGTEPYKVTHNQLLAHASAVSLYRNKYQQVQKGKIGIVIVSFWFVPYDGEYESQRARDRSFDFMVGWTMDPITFGRYPESMRKRVGDRLPEFTEEEAEMLRGSFDFIGLNYYTAYYSISIADTPRSQASYSTDSGSVFTGYKNGIPIGEPSTNGRYFSYPKGLSGLLRYMKVKYNDPEIYITENGFGTTRKDMLGAMEDHDRKKYFVDHLCCLKEAIEEEGANVKGYFPWTLTDNFNWATGYLVRFGIHYVDFKDKSLRRRPNLSAQWLKTVFGPVNETGNVSDI